MDPGFRRFCKYCVDYKGARSKWWWLLQHAERGGLKVEYIEYPISDNESKKNNLKMHEGITFSATQIVYEPTRPWMSPQGGSHCMKD